jgi:Domain of unknown function (DUF4342)
VPNERHPNVNGARFNDTGQLHLVDSLEAAGIQLIDTIRKVVREGNVRKIIVKQSGETIAEFPLTFGVVGAVIAPALAAIGAITALVPDCTIKVEPAKTPEQRLWRPNSPAPVLRRRPASCRGRDIGHAVRPLFR